MPSFSVDQLSNIAVKLFVAGGVKEPIAREVVESLVLSNLLGMDSHGVVRVRDYLDAIRAGAIVPNAEAEVVRDSGAVVFMDGRKAFGQIVAKKAMKLAIQKAREHNIGAVSFTDVAHIGRLGEYVTMAADEGLIGLIMANGSKPGGNVAPFGARQTVLGTNPIAFSIPAGSYPPLTADFSTSSVAEGRIRIALRKGQRVRPGLLIDREGRPTTNPADLYEGGALLSAGEHKGYALSLLVEVVGGILSGAGTPVSPNYGRPHNGVFALALNPTFFQPETEFRAAVDLLFTSVKQALPAEGMQGALIPGEPELRSKAIREKEGIPIDANTWAELLEVAAALNVRIADN